jgi:hypothetical protein
MHLGCNEDKFVSVCDAWSKAILVLAGRMIENGTDITRGCDFQLNSATLV